MTLQVLLLGSIINVGNVYFVWNPVRNISGDTEIMPQELIKILHASACLRLNHECISAVDVLYHSDMSHQERLYGPLDVDLCRIKLHEPLHVIVQQPLLYVRDMVPKPCFEALVKLHEVITIFLKYLAELSPKILTLVYIFSCWRLTSCEMHSAMSCFPVLRWLSQWVENLVFHSPLKTSNVRLYPYARVTLMNRKTNW